MGIHDESLHSDNANPHIAASYPGMPSEQELLARNVGSKHARQSSHSISDESISNSSHQDQDASTINSAKPKQHLPFSTLGLVGRSHEQQTLQRAVDAVFSSEEDPQHTMVLIAGPSGSGKSALALHFQQQCFERHAFFVTGKFDLKQTEEPYSGIKAAMADLCRQMLALKPGPDDSSFSGSSSSDIEDPRLFSTLRTLITDGLSAYEMQALSKVVPDIRNVLDLSSTSTSTNSTTNASSKLQRSPSMASSSSGSTDGNNRQAGTSRLGYREQSGRLKFVLRKFMQICCQICPVIMVIDDLQWGDKASMDLLQSWLLMDAGKSSGTADRHHSLLIMGCYRSEASEHSAILQDCIEALKDAQETRSINIVEVGLDDMKVSQVHELVCGLLLPPQNKAGSTNSISKSSPTIIGGYESLALANLVHKRTGGNVFFVKQFLQQLWHDDLIYYDHTGHHWAWKSEAELLEKSTATTNIIDMMKLKLNHVEAARHILPIAACFGATFSKSKLLTVIRALSIHSDHAAFFKTMFDMPRHGIDSWAGDILRSCEREGLVEAHQHKKRKSKKTAERRSSNNQTNSSNRDMMYSFVHDKVQEASFSLIPADSVTELQYRVGFILSSCLSPVELEDSIFMVASLINLRLDLVPKSNRSDRRMKIAMLNNMAGEKAVSCSAFQSALSYFKTAISLLPEDHWESRPEESLNLYSSVAECSMMTSDMEQVRTYAAQVTSQECPILNKIRAYHILIDAATAEVENNKDLDPVGLCLFVLSELGFKFPQNNMVRTFATVFGMLKMKRCVPKWSITHFDDVPLCTDPKELAITKTLRKLSIIAYLLNPDILPLTIIKLIDRTLEHGISQHSLPSLSLSGIIVGHFMGDFHSARKLAHIALRLRNRVECHETKAQTMFVAHSMCLHWTSPVEDGQASLLQTYNIGMATGDVDSAIWSIYNYMHAQLAIGTPLLVVNDELAMYIPVMKDFHQTSQFHICAMMWQAVHNLQGKTQNRTLLVGDVYDEEAELKRLDTNPNPQLPLFLKTMKLYAALHFGDFAIGAKVAVETYGERLKNHAGLIGLPPGIFDSGMCCYATCFDKSIPSKSRKLYKKTARACRAKLREWQGKGNSNCDPYVAMLDAEHCALKDKHEAAIKLYAIAIALTKSRGYLQYEALAHERLADHLLKGDGNNRSKAKEHMNTSIDLTEQWGATAKVIQLCNKYDEFLRGAGSSNV